MYNSANMGRLQELKVRAGHVKEEFRHGVKVAIQGIGEAVQPIVAKGTELVSQAATSAGQASEWALAKKTEAEMHAHRLIALSARVPADLLLESYRRLIDSRQRTTVYEEMGGMSEEEKSMLRSFMSAEILQQVHSVAIGGLFKNLSALITPATQESGLPATVGNEGFIRREHVQKGALILEDQIQSLIQSAAEAFENEASQMIREDQSVPLDERNRIALQLPAMREAAQAFVAIVQPSLSKLSTLTDSKQINALAVEHKDQVLQIARQFNQNRTAVSAN